MGNIIGEIAAAIQRNPKINRVFVSKLEHAKIRREITKMTFLRSSPRPTYGPPFGDVDRQIWDAAKAMRRLAEIRIMGRTVEAR